MCLATRASVAILSQAGGLVDKVQRHCNIRFKQSILIYQVHILTAACENMIDGKGMRPGDILQAANGKTVEVRSVLRSSPQNILRRNLYSETVDALLLALVFLIDGRRDTVASRVTITE